MPDDALILRRMRAGDAAAFTAIYSRCQGPLYRFALQMSGDERLAEEVVHDVFLALIRDEVAFDAERGSLQNFLFGVTRNHVMRRLAGSREVGIDDMDAATSEDALRDLTRRETVESVRQAVLSLPANYREVVVLCELQELSYEDAARALGCAVGTVRSRLHRGRALLVEKLKVKLRCLA
jgi:RNA polymerase sigma-70 factor, ECF subfamily